MPQSLSAVYVHLVFSTKDRRPFLRDKTTRDALHSYLGGVSKQLDCPPILVGGVIGLYVWRNRHGASSLRNAGLMYRPLGAPGEPYPQWVRDLKGESGVYIIRERDSREIVYVGSSVGRLYNTMTRHFQQWRRWKGFWKGQYGEGHDPGLTYNRDSVEVAVRITRASDALDEESRLIHRMRPRDNLIGQPNEEEVPF